MGIQVAGLKEAGAVGGGGCQALTGPGFWEGTKRGLQSERGRRDPTMENPLEGRGQRPDSTGVRP